MNAEEGWVSVAHEGREGWEEQARLSGETENFVPARPGFEDEVLVATVPLTSRSEIRARLQTWKGERRCDLRVFTHYVKRDESRPTQRGVSLPIGRARELLDAVRLLHEAAEREQQ